MPAILENVRERQRRNESVMAQQMQNAMEHSHPQRRPVHLRQHDGRSHCKR